MDETSLRGLLERTTVPEPPLGPLAQNALRAGIKLRRRRRIQGITAAAATAVVCAAALAVTGATGHRAAAPARIPATLYVLGGPQILSTVTPISTTSNRPGRPIVVSTGSGSGGLGTQLAVTPDGKTIWVADGDIDVTPISTATNRAGNPVPVVYLPQEGTSQVLASPNGKTVYVLDSTDTVTPISTATHQPGQPIELRYRGGQYAEMAISPDAKTLYVAMFAPLGTGPSYVIVINTASNRISTRIRVLTAATAIVITPDGKTVYIIGQSARPPRAPGPAQDRSIEVTPIATATNRAGKPIIVGRGVVGMDTAVALTPDGRTLYIPDNTYLPDGTPNGDGVIPFSTATNTPETLIRFGAAAVLQIAVTPDGSTAYVLSQPPGNTTPVVAIGSYGATLECVGAPGAVTPIATATNTTGTPVKVGCEPIAIAITPDSKTVYVGCGSGTVTPIATATRQPGKPINVGGIKAMLITP